MKRLLLLLCCVLMFGHPAFSAEVPDDDSVPYMPYTVQPQAEPTPTPARPKTPAKKTTTRKTTTRKTTTTTKKAATPKPARPSSLQQGIALMNEHKYEAAKPYLLKAIQENRNDPNAWYWYGVYHEKTGGYYQAQYFYSKAVMIDPAFEPLSRVVYQPNDSEKTPLWDPKRPARVYEVSTANNGIAMNSPNSLGLSSFPEAPNDPELPRVPVYTPPEPGSSPLGGDSWAPAVYVPPSPEEIDGQTPAYTPPSAQGVVAAEDRQTLELAVYRREVASVNSANDWDTHHTPQYTPPEPGPQDIRLPQQTNKRSTTKKTTVSSTKNTPKTTAVPKSRVVRQSAKKTSSTAKPAITTPARTQSQPRRTTSPDIRPSTPVRPAQPEVVRQPEPEPPVQPAARQTEYLPPVGQYAPDPGTISETAMPPVGQGSQY